MKISKRLKDLLIEELSSRYENNRRKLSIDGLHIHYEQEEIEKMKEENKRILILLEQLRQND